MGQVIAFPGKREQASVSADRRAAVITGLAALTFVVGFFLAGPVLAIYAFGYVTSAHRLSAAACVGGLLVTWALTRHAYKRL